jgi:hypothetical protein
MKYDKFKSIYLGFESPYIDIESLTGVEDLQRELIATYSNSMEVIDSGIEIYKLNDLNHLFYFRLVGIIDTSITSSEEFDKIADDIKSKISNRIKEFLELNKIIFRDING